MFTSPFMSALLLAGIGTMVAARVRFFIHCRSGMLRGVAGNSRNGAGCHALRTQHREYAEKRSKSTLQLFHALLY